MLAMPLRSLTDTVGATTISMRLFLLALPVNGLLNYAFIFGKWGLPPWAVSEPALRLF